jgi:hypothetical protein
MSDRGDRSDGVFFNTKQAAFYLTLSPRTLEKMRQRGHGPRYRKHGGVVRYHVDDLAEWSARRTKIRTTDARENGDA